MSYLDDQQGNELGYDVRVPIPGLKPPFSVSCLMSFSNTEIAASASLDTLIALTVELVDHIRQEIRIIDFWRNTYAQNVLRVWIIRFLDDHDAVPFNRQQAVSDRLVELAKALHTRLLT